MKQILNDQSGLFSSREEAEDNFLRGVILEHQRLVKTRVGYAILILALAGMLLCSLLCNAVLWISR
jgi:hypothetical protein